MEAKTGWVLCTNQEWRLVLGIEEIKSVVFRVVQNVVYANFDTEMTLLIFFQKRNVKLVKATKGSWSNIVKEHQELSGKSDEYKSFKSNQLAPSIYIMVELCFFSLDQLEIKIHLL